MKSILKLLLFSTFFSIAHGTAASGDGSDGPSRSSDRGIMFGCITLPDELIVGHPALVSFIETLPQYSKKAAQLISDIKSMHGEISVVLADNLDPPANWEREKKQFLFHEIFCQINLISGEIFYLRCVTQPMKLF